MSVTSISGYIGHHNDTVRRVCIHREIDNIADTTVDFALIMLRSLAQHVSELRSDEDTGTQRATLLALAGYAQHRVEELDREAAR